MLATGFVHAIKIPHFSRAVRMFDAPVCRHTACLTGPRGCDNVSKYFHKEIKFPGTNDHSANATRARAVRWWLENLLIYN